VPHHQSENCASTVWRRLWERFFSRFSFIRISDMVNTRSSHPLQPQLLQQPLSAPGASNSPELADFLKSMVESMEVLRKQNEELNARLTAAEAQSSEKERRDRVHREKRLVNPNQQDHESTVQGGRRMIHDEEHRNKSRRVESPNGGSRRERSRHERSRHEGSRQERHEEERSHRSRRHRDKSHHDKSQHNLHDAKMKDLEDKYSRILRRMNGEVLCISYCNKGILGIIQSRLSTKPTRLQRKCQDLNPSLRSQNTSPGPPRSQNSRP
jgi:hypothetical protein